MLFDVAEAAVDECAGCELRVDGEDEAEASNEG